MKASVVKNSNVFFFQAKAKKESDGDVQESGLDDIVNALHKNNLLRIRRDNQRAGVPPPPELQGLYSHDLWNTYSYHTAVLQLRKNLKRTSFYSKQGLAYEMLFSCKPLLKFSETDQQNQIIQNPCGEQSVSFVAYKKDYLTANSSRTASRGYFRHFIALFAW